MLDFRKLMPQIETLAPEVTVENTDRVQLAAEVYLDAQANSRSFKSKLSDSEQLTFWPLSMPIENFATRQPVTPYVEPHTVVAVDGSQIMPSQHEVYSCYLINLGQTTISYGSRAPVILESTPLLFHTVQDIYPLIDRRRVHVDESYVVFERTLKELSSLRDLSIQAQERALPVVSFVDGSLRIWSLEKMSETYQRYYLDRLIPVLDSFQRNRLPLVGYVSHSRSSDVVNALRTWRCPYDVSNCEKLCGHLQEDEFPCSDIWPALDRNIMQKCLDRHERGPIMAASSAKDLPLPDAHRRCFVYLNVGKEVARLEFPRWLADDSNLLNDTLKIVLAQADKGGGYPVCLAEAHNLAVVRAADRSRFFEIVGKHLVEIGVQRVKISPKETGKRRSII